VSDGGAKFQAIPLGSEYAGYTIDFYAAGTSDDKEVWTAEDKTGATFRITANTLGIATFYGDGDYKMVGLTSTGSTLFTWPNVKITSDTATMWEGNSGTALPTATEANRNQLFALLDANNVLLGLYINQGATPTWKAIVTGLGDTTSFTDLVGAAGYTPATYQVSFDATNINLERDFSLPTDGTDASIPLKQGITAWLALAYPGVLRFPDRRQITLSNPVSYNFTASDGRKKIIEGNGCRIRNELALAGEIALEFKMSGGTTYVSKFEFNDLDFIQSDATNLSTCFRVAGGDGWMNNISMDNITVSGFGDGIGIHIDNVGESSFTHLSAYGPYNIDTTIVYYGTGIKISNTDTNSAYVTNALSFHGVRTNGGAYGIDVPAAQNDCMFYGLGIWNAYYYGIRIANGFSGTIDGAHMENNFRSAGATPTGAHLRINACSGEAVLKRITGSTVETVDSATGDVTASYYAYYVMDVALVGATGFSNTLTVLGGANLTRKTDKKYYYGNFTTTAGSKAVIIGQKQNQVYDGTAGVQAITGWVTRTPYNIPKSNNIGNALTGTVAVEMDNGGFHLGVLDDAAAITFANPTSGLYGSLIPNGTPLTIQIKQAGVTASTVDFDTDYAGGSAAGTALSSYSSWTFRYNGGKWVLDTETIGVY